MLLTRTGLNILVLFLILLLSLPLYAENNSQMPEVKSDIDGADDPLETRVIISSGSIGMNIKGKANFLRSFIDKSTGDPTYQLYVQTKTYGLNNWNKAKFLYNGKLIQLEANTLKTIEVCSKWGCTYTIDSVIDMDRATVEMFTKKETTVRLASSNTTETKDIDVDENDAKDFLDSVDQISTYFKHKANSDSQTVSTK